MKFHQKNTECKNPRCPDCLIVALNGVVRVLGNLRTSFAIDYSRMSFSHSEILELQLDRAKKQIAKAEGQD